MNLKERWSNATFKSLAWYGVLAVGLLVVAVPVLANNSSTGSYFSFRGPSGRTLETARPLTKGLNVNHLKPGEENWYVYSQENFDPVPADRISLALRYESEAVISPQEANFEIVAQAQENVWAQAAEAGQQVLDTGQPSLIRAHDRNLVETFWTGLIEEDEHYYVRVFNHSPFSLNYSLEANATGTAAPTAENAAIVAATKTEARQLAWTLTAQAVENMDATRAARWMQEAQAVGWLVTAATDPALIPNPEEADPQLLWRLTAQAVEGQEAATAAQWLIQADALGWLSIPPAVPDNPYTDPIQPEIDDGEEGGGVEPDEVASVPAPPDDVYQPVNVYPNDPLTFNFEAANTGRLGPYGEHWYAVSRDDLDDDLFEDLKLTMFFTPSKGFISNRVNFEIFPAGQYHIWQRGDADYMENIGAGTWVSRDKDPNTSERLWNGSLVDGDRYLIKVKNGTPDEVDYYLFPNDIENAELGHPTLHKARGLAQPAPYPVAPPTRSGPPPKPGSGPPEAKPLAVGLTNGELEAGQEIWYKFTFPSEFKTKSLEERDFIIYLTSTPLDEVRARHADFEIYPGNQLHFWTRGTIDEFKPLGASAPATFAQLADQRSRQVLWSGQLMAEHVYYVKIYNHDIGALKYELKVKEGGIVD